MSIQRGFFMPRYQKNVHLNGIEIYFESIPNESIRQELKNNGFRWHHANKFWYAKETEGRLALAQRLCGTASTLKKVTTPEVKKASMINERCCYANSIQGFLAEEESTWLQIMQSTFLDKYTLDLSDSQVKAWIDCFRCLKKYLPLLNDANKSFSIIFEYSLPYESGRRPDVLLVSREQVIILEFKMKKGFLTSDIDQAAAYSRDIREYHFESREKKVTSILVLTKTKDKKPKEQKGIIICSVD